MLQTEDTPIHVPFTDLRAYVENRIARHQAKAIEWHLGRCDVCRWALTAFDPVSEPSVKAKPQVVLKPRPKIRVRLGKKLWQFLYARSVLIGMTVLLTLCTFAAIFAIALSPLWTPLDELLLEPVLSKGRVIYQEFLTPKQLPQTPLQALQEALKPLELQKLPSPAFALAFFKSASALDASQQLFLVAAQNLENKCQKNTQCLQALHVRQANAWGQWALLAGYLESDRIQQLDILLVNDFIAWAQQLVWPDISAAQTFSASLAALNKYRSPQILRIVVWQLLIPHNDATL